ncbi:hypothetical protein CC80DRAFT_467903 [Byssothecium circinans]|uniref:Fe2OG dioxygenase domain-containing protein n=1 Tax=Byssothecium circinans TaxID=147558 RepID=A0A6A5U3W2_9PLEO|nr:hypothetical protein CC80DRAFT_467903 [Byssothecium circinans]
MAKLTTETQRKSPPSEKKSKSKFGLSPTELAGLAAFLLLPFVVAALFSGQIPTFLSPSTNTNTSQNDETQTPDPIDPASPSLLAACYNHTYTTEIISLDPLMIYINNFTSAAEAQALINLGTPSFTPSFISQTSGRTAVDAGRTSHSAPLDDDHPLVSCILSRARAFMGTTMLPHEPFSLPQLVRYFPGQRYNLHTDFWPVHQRTRTTGPDGVVRERKFNRPASFFVFLRDACVGGETFFPGVDVDVDGDGDGDGTDASGPKVSKGEKDGVPMGVKFRPMTGNAIFWVNLDQQGRGDRRVVHAGLPVREGEKIGMNLWPRKFYS